MFKNLFFLSYIGLVFGQLYTNSFNVTSISSDCTSSNAIAENIILSMTPDKPVVGKNDTLLIEYDLMKPVDSGNVIFKASLNGFPVVNSKEDLCDMIKDGDDPCPLHIGHHKTSSTIQMPSVSGMLESTMTWNSIDEEIFCIHIKVDL